MADRAGTGTSGNHWADGLRDLLVDRDGEPLRWPWPDRPPTPHGRRLMEAIGVVGLPEEEPVTSVQTLSETQDCVTPLCVTDALPGLAHCRRHASIADIRGVRENGHQAYGLAALEAMDRGDPQGALGEPGGSTARKSAEDVRAVPAEPGSPNAAAATPCKTPGCPNQANTRYDRGMLSRLCEETCMPARRKEISAENVERAAKRKDRRPERQVRTPKAPEKRTPTPSPATAEMSLSPPAVVGESPEPVGAELGARTDEPSASSFVPSTEVTKQEVAATPDIDRTSVSGDGGGGFNLSLALTGDFAHDAQRVRQEASKLRAQAGALDVIAEGIDQLAETIA